MHLDLPEETPVPDLIASITRATSQRLVLILDQFERFFEPDVSGPERDALRRDLSGAIARVEPSLFRIIIAIRDDVQSVLDRQWDDLLPGLDQSTVYLRPLSRMQAKDAIKQPIKTLLTQPVFSDTFLDSYLLPDLERLSSGGPDCFLPADLQIVCSHLFQTARSKDREIIERLLLRDHRRQGRRTDHRHTFRGAACRGQGRAPRPGAADRH